MNLFRAKNGDLKVLGKNEAMKLMLSKPLPRKGPNGNRNQFTARVRG